MIYISVARFTPKEINIREIKELMSSEQLIYLWKKEKMIYRNIYTIIN